MPGLQPGQAAGSVAVSVVIRKSGYAYMWVCKIKVQRLTGPESCDYTDIEATEAEAHAAYDKHKRRAH